MYTEVCKIIEASQAGDKQKAEAYARLLATNLEKAGQPKEATRILRALGDQTLQSPPVGLDSVAICHTGETCHHQPQGCPTACEKAMGFNPFAPLSNAVSFDFTASPTHHRVINTGPTEGGLTR
jgi:hypothetical protein